MCEKCDEIDGKIAHYKGMTRLITDKQTLDGIVQLIEKMKAEKAAFGCDQPDEK
jgi:hypothetical protein